MYTGDSYAGLKDILLKEMTLKSSRKVMGVYEYYMGIKIK